MTKLIAITLVVGVACFAQANEIKIKILQNSKSGFHAADEIIFSEQGAKVNKLNLAKLSKERLNQYKKFFREFEVQNTGTCESGYFLFARNLQKDSGGDSRVIVACNKGPKFAELMDQVHQIKSEGIR